MFAVAKLWARLRPAWFPRKRQPDQALSGEGIADSQGPRPKPSTRGPLIASLVSPVLGGVSHILLDSFMHRDMRPLWPFTNGNALLGVIDIGTLHIALAASGFFGLMFWLLLADSR